MSSMSEQERPLPVLLDEKLSGPLYGLPGVQVGVSKLTGYPRSRQGDLGSQRVAFELEMLSWKALWNADLPIHSLPPELLVDIIDHFSVLDDSTTRPWAHLMMVCRHWCALIRNTAHFWTAVRIKSVGTSLEFAKLALRRAGRAPLRIHTSSRIMDIVIHLVAAHADHIRELNIECWSAPPAPWLESLFASTFPSLVKLRVSLEWSSSVQEGLQYNSQINPSLESLALERVPLSWSTSLVANLRELSLHDCWIENSPMSWADFLDVLEHGQQLGVLELHNFMSGAIVPDTPITPLCSSTLPNLRILSCKDEPANVKRLLSHIRAHDECTFSLEGITRGHTTSSIVSVLPDNPAAVFLALQRPHDASSVPVIDIEEANHVVTVSWRPGHHRGLGALTIYLDSSLDWALQQLPEVLELLPPMSPPVLGLKISGRVDAVPSQIWNTLFDSLPGIEQLSIRSASGYFPYDLAMSLGEPFPPGISLPHSASRYLHPFVPSTDVTQGVRLPALRDLSIYRWRWRASAVKSVLACLQARESHGVPRLGDLTVGAKEDPEDDADCDDSSDWPWKDMGDENIASLSALTDRFHEW
ncbi:hypothetical protein C8Q77DRAFT_1080429 [Trametes polyzona]|nr:hypothetical protein C8Q77DRAFT_1080429 [Trametes polyzona]